jgi:hypothetical protein
MNTKNSERDWPIGLRPWQHGLIFLVACIVIASHRPDAISHAQFFAEDGRIFFADAYNLGWHSLLHPYGGYFHAFPRLAAMLALLVPFSAAPLMLNLLAIVAQAIPVSMLLSARSSPWGSLPFRAIMAGIYVALPNSMELVGIITNTQCLLSLGAFLLLVQTVPRGMVGRPFAVSFLLLCALSGPYCIFLLPVAIFYGWKSGRPWSWALAGILAMSSLVQGFGLLVLSPSARPHYVLGATPALFARILAGNVYLGTLIGINGIAALPGQRILVFLICVAFGGTAIVGICFFRSSIEMRLFLVFSSIVLAASLISPMVVSLNGLSLWEEMASKGAGGIHYWFFPTLAFGWSLLWCFQSRTAVLKTVSGALLCLMCLGIVLGWRYPAFKDMHFAEHAQRFNKAPVGTEITIPENPEGWSIRLVKRQVNR